MHVNGKINLELTSAWQKGRIEVLVSSDLDDNMLWGVNLTPKRIRANTTRIPKYNFER